MSIDVSISQHSMEIMRYTADGTPVYRGDDTMIGGFTFNNINSSEFQLVGRSVTRPLVPAAKTRRVEFDHISGVYDVTNQYGFPDSEYGTRTITMRIVYIGDDYHELRRRARAIAAWLITDNWSKLILNDEPDKYYLAKIRGELNLQSMWQAGFIDVAFECQPFAYGEEISVTVPANSSSYILDNPGTREINFRSPHGTKYTIKATVVPGSSFAIWPTGLSFKGSGDILIDNVKMEVTDYHNGGNLFRLIDMESGTPDKFIRLRPGKNYLYIYNVPSDIIVTWTPLWY